MDIGDIIPGCAPGIVRHIDDPTGMGRIKVEIPGVLQETPYWVMPMGWPGAGGANHKGSQYPPPPIGAQVIVLFMWGIWDSPNAQAFYLSGYYGHLEDGVSAGPTVIAQATTADDARKRVCFWETDKFAIYAIDDDEDKKVVIQALTSGSKIELNAADGLSKMSETITLESRTGIRIYSRGVVDIRGDAGVEINGRKVSSDIKRSSI